MLFQVFLIFYFKPGLFAPKTGPFPLFPAALGGMVVSRDHGRSKCKREEVKKVHAQENGGIQPVVPEKGRIGGPGLG